MNALLLLALLGTYTDVGYASTTGATFTGNFGPGAFGVKLCLDLDCDSNISPSADDTFQLEVNGADRVEFTATTTAFRTSTDSGNVLALADTSVTIPVIAALQNGMSLAADADLAAGACTANRLFRDTGGATREICWCNAGGTAYDCISVTTANGPTD